MLASNSFFKRYLQQQLPLYIFVSVLFFMGVIFGAFMVGTLTFEQQQVMSDYLNSFFQTIVQGFDGEQPQPFGDIFISHFKWVLLILVFGLSIVGLPLILIIDFLKGVLIGFSIGYLVNQFSWKGLFFAFLSVAPHNIIVIPVILIASVTAISFSLYLIRSLVLKRKAMDSQPFKSYVATHLALIGLLAGAALIQYLLIPQLLEWAAPIMLETS